MRADSLPDLIRCPKQVSTSIVEVLSPLSCALNNRTTYSAVDYSCAVEIEEWSSIWSILSLAM